MSFGGYSEERSGVPPFDPETIREILASQSAGTGGRPLGQELSQGIYNSNGAPPPAARQSPPRSNASRQNSFAPQQQGSRQNSFAPQQQGSRQNSFAPQQQSSRQNSFAQHTPPRDAFRDENGDWVQTYNGPGQPELRCHNYDPEWTGLKTVSRTNSGTVAPTNPNISSYTNESGEYVRESTGPMQLRTHTPPPTDGRPSPPVYSSRDNEGNYVQQYAGDDGDLELRAHYNWDHPEKNHY